MANRKKILFSILLESIRLRQTNGHLFRELGSEKEDIRDTVTTCDLQDFLSCLCQFSLLFFFLGGGRVRSVFLGASKSSNRSPLFVKLLLREVKVKVFRFYFSKYLSTRVDRFCRGLELDALIL